MIKVQGSHILPQAAAGQVYTSERYAWSGHETEHSLSNIVWKAEALKMVVSRICIVVGGEDHFMEGTSNSHQDKWKEKNILERGEEKEMWKQQTNKEKKKN